MIKIISLLAIIAFATGSEMPMKVGSPSTSLPLPKLMRTIRNAPEVPVMETQVDDQIVTTVAPAEAGPTDDMAKAETFGFGFHKHIYVAPQYYGGYYGGYYPYNSYYPSYGYGQPYYY
ncbi:uncharacterized protein LOC134209315 [Armigeres subalbatus]|uniref:uncharacterized protein LOC134209315 n=1 Tax=Armigeres subalbatus TaxID=124917 RepID=UPI002ED2DB82